MINFANAFRPIAITAALLSLTVLTAPAIPASAQAQSDLRIATSYKLMTLDPHYANLNENTSLLSNISVYATLTSARHPTPATIVRPARE
ncbi:hypothetical protein [Agrobacterium radiobacter]|uniref:hypothetical protein n=1 Tax=Agrobacterium radiobacter TaxID=362 RepID=UPI003EBEE90F